MEITKQQVLQALSHVEEPDLKKDLVTLNMIRDIHIDGNKLSFSVVLTTPACPLKGLIENACRNAIAHFISKDIAVTVNMTSQVTTQRNTGVPGVKNIIAVASGKGGVGKSTVSVNLALALAKAGAKVGLIDADIYGPSIPIMFGLEGARPMATQENGKTRIEPIEKYGIKLLSIGFFTDPNQPVPWRGPMVSTAVKQLFNDADWGELDYLVIDLPPGTGDIHITVTQSFPITGAVVVTTPQNVALADAKKGIGMFMMEAINVPVMGIVENMAYFTPAELPENKYYIFGQGGGQKLAAQLEVPFLGEIPLVKGISDSGDAGKPIVLDETSPMNQAFMLMAERVAQQVSIINAERTHVLNAVNN
ncbi:Mrp/NBP35 family ATP-binding protein [Mucilaginibacter sp.]|uniref:Mrp/NBP35 family ATP-binding protein n=1 Tax=Mucilaginibacter sp. TaxID=1882438 RepID=UPI000CBD128B|nr:Mrp/NBP35 family ATP-binding protein [Mucilaginibacter sp.]PLW90395.1 MAG: MRP family ATP-binding protein [Mucilaginibacter sp.]HEK20405.1 iron-sulfur cluster carrier protein ApbC [Bacteroidota bacterium]